jgi:hypothetical protein
MQDKLISISKAMLEVLKRSREGKILRVEFHRSIDYFEGELAVIFPPEFPK